MMIVSVLALGVTLIKREIVSRTAVAIVLAVLGVIFLVGALFVGAVSAMGFFYLGAALWVRRPSSSRSRPAT